MKRTKTSKNGSPTIRVLVAATSAIRGAGLETTVKADSRVKVVGRAPALSAVSSQIRLLQPDVVLIDLDGPDPQFLATVSPNDSAATAVLVDAPQPAWTARALRNGVKSILPRDAAPYEISSAIHAAHAGLVLLDAAVTENLAHHLQAESTHSTAETFDHLTPREIEILRMLAEGLGNRQLAAALGISEHTVKFHISSILDKLGAASRTEAVTSGIRLGLVFI